MSICLLPEKVAEFRQALKDKKLDMEKLLDPKMSSETRTKIFEEYAGTNAKDINTLFEEKVILKNKILGIQNMFTKLGEFGKYSPQGKVDMAKTISEYKSLQQQKIFSPTENQAFLNDLADKMVGTHISQDVAQKVWNLNQKANALKDVNPKLSGVSDEYLKARTDLQNYVDSQKPLSKISSVGKNLAIIGRNNLLLNVSTPIKATAGQVVNSVMDAVSRRIGSLSLGGANAELASQASNEAWQTFRKTGLNTAAMESIDDTHVLGKGENFKVPTGGGEHQIGFKGGLREIASAGKQALANPKMSGAFGETLTRKLAETSNKVAIDWEHNLSFTKLYQKAFFDMGNVLSTNIARNEGLVGDALKTRSAEILKDAARIQPQTDVGAMVRLEAQKQSARVTSTNETFLSRLSIQTKNALNKVIPGFPLGDFVLPIARIPANIIANGIENAGVGIPMGIKDIFQGREKMTSLDLATKYQGMVQYANGIQKVARTFGSIGVAAMLANSFQKSDFKTDRYGAHYVNIAGNWINTEYISAISPALAGFMMMKEQGKSGQGLLANVGQYTAGALTGLKSAPGIDEASQLISSITNSNYAKGIQKYASSFFTSRGEPAFLRQLLNGQGIKGLLLSTTGSPTPQELKKLGAK